MKLITLAVCALLMLQGRSMAADPAGKPRLKLAADKFPAGHATPEGAACDLARAFITRDAALFADTCVKPYGGGESRKSYEGFLANVTESMKKEAAQEKPSPGGPKSIGKVFAARRLSKEGPASYGYAAFGFQDVMFVDVGVFLYDGKTSLTRALVIKKDHAWYVDPAPQLSPLLSAGMNEESASTRDFSDAYEIEP